MSDADDETRVCFASKGQGYADGVAQGGAGQVGHAPEWLDHYEAGTWCGAAGSATCAA